MVVSYGRTRFIRLAALACLACAAFMTMLQISRYARRPSHFSSPSSSHDYSHLSSDRKQQEAKDMSTTTTTTRTPESLRADLDEYYWGNLTRKIHPDLEEGEGNHDVRVFVQRIMVPPLSSASSSSSSSVKRGSGLVRSKSNFLPAHGFVRPRLSRGSKNGKEQEQDDHEEGKKKEKGFYWPISRPLTLPVLPLHSSPKTFKTGSSPASSSSSSSSSSSLLLGVATTYPRISFSNFRMITETWKQSLSGLRTGGTGPAAGLIVALEDGTEEERIQVRDALYRSGIVDCSVFIPQRRTDTDKGSVHAQLFQQMMTARFGVGEMGAGKARRWFGIMDEGARFVPGEGLIEGLDGVFGGGGVGENEDGRWYIGFSSVQEDWWVGDTTKGGNKKTSRRRGGGGGGGGGFGFGDEAVMLMSQSVLDTAGQLMCFQGGGKGLSRQQRKMSWNQLLYECLMEGDEDLKYHVLGDGDGDGDGEESLPQRPLVIKETGNGLIDAAAAAAVPPAILFEDYWIVRPGKKITCYRDGVEVKEQVKEVTRKPEGKKVSERVILHSPFPPGTKTETLVWRGKKKTWELLDTELREHEGRQEVWQAYMNKKGGNGQQSEEVSSVDSLVILIWEVGTNI